MNRTLKVLIIEDEPLIVDAYQRALKITTDNEKLKFEIEIANNCDIAITKLNIAKANGGMDLAFLDIRIPRSKSRKILCGEDLGLKIRKTFKDIKIIVSTSYNDPFRISSILRNLNPDGFLVKNDLAMSTLVEAIKTVIHSPPFYSQTVNQIFRKTIY